MDVPIFPNNVSPTRLACGVLTVKKGYRLGSGGRAVPPSCRDWFPRLLALSSPGPCPIFSWRPRLSILDVAIACVSHLHSFPNPCSANLSCGRAYQFQMLYLHPYLHLCCIWIVCICICICGACALHLHLLLRAVALHWGHFRQICPWAGTSVKNAQFLSIFLGGPWHRI